MKFNIQVLDLQSSAPHHTVAAHASRPTPAPGCGSNGRHAKVASAKSEDIDVFKAILRVISRPSFEQRFKDWLSLRIMDLDHPPALSFCSPMDIVPRELEDASNVSSLAYGATRRRRLKLRSSHIRKHLDARPPSRKSSRTALPTYLTQANFTDVPDHILRFYSRR